MVGVVASVDWSGLTIPAAFILGCIVGGAAIIRVTRFVLEYLQRHDKKDE